MPEWIIAMFLIGALLSAGDMAKIFLEARRSRREAAVYDNHPQKLQMEHYADSFRVLAESFYQMPSKSVKPLCEGVVVLGAVRKPDARAVPGTSSDNRRRG